MSVVEVPQLERWAVGSPPTASVARDLGHTLVRLEGEHDVASLFVLADALALAVELDGDADLVIDLRSVEFVSAATIGLLIHARNALREQSRELMLLSPAPCARRALGLCGLGDAVIVTVADLMPPARRRTGTAADTPPG